MVRRINRGTDKSAFLVNSCIFQYPLLISYQAVFGITCCRVYLDRLKLINILKLPIIIELSVLEPADPGAHYHLPAAADNIRRRTVYRVSIHNKRMNLKTKTGNDRERGIGRVILDGQYFLMIIDLNRSAISAACLYSVELFKEIF